MEEGIDQWLTQDPDAPQNDPGGSLGEANWPFWFGSNNDTQTPPEMDLDPINGVPEASQSSPGPSMTEGSLVVPGSLDPVQPQGSWTRPEEPQPTAAPEDPRYPEMALVPFNGVPATPQPLPDPFMAEGSPVEGSLPPVQAQGPWTRRGEPWSRAALEAPNYPDMAPARLHGVVEASQPLPDPFITEGALVAGGFAGNPLQAIWPPADLLARFYEILRAFEHRWVMPLGFIEDEEDALQAPDFNDQLGQGPFNTPNQERHTPINWQAGDSPYQGHIPGLEQDSPISDADRTISDRGESPEADVTFDRNSPAFRRQIQRQRQMDIEQAAIDQVNDRIEQPRRQRYMDIDQVNDRDESPEADVAFDRNSPTFHRQLRRERQMAIDQAAIDQENQENMSGTMSPAGDHSSPLTTQPGPPIATQAEDNNNMFIDHANEENMSGTMNPTGDHSSPLATQPGLQVANQAEDDNNILNLSNEGLAGAMTGYLSQNYLAPSSEEPIRPRHSQPTREMAAFLDERIAQRQEVDAAAGFNAPEVMGYDPLEEKLAPENEVIEAARCARAARLVFGEATRIGYYDHELMAGAYPEPDFRWKDPDLEISKEEIDELIDGVHVGTGASTKQRYHNANKKVKVDAGNASKAVGPGDDYTQEELWVIHAANVSEQRVKEAGPFTAGEATHHQVSPDQLARQSESYPRQDVLPKTVHSLTPLRGRPSKIPRLEISPGHSPSLAESVGSMSLDSFKTARESPQVTGFTPDTKPQPISSYHTDRPSTPPNGRTSHKSKGSKRRQAANNKSTKNIFAAVENRNATTPGSGSSGSSLPRLQPSPLGGYPARGYQNHSWNAAGNPGTPTRSSRRRSEGNPAHQPTTGNRDSPTPNRRHSGLNLPNRPTGRNNQSSFHQPTGGNRDSPAPPNRRHNGLNLANRPTGRNHQSSFHQPTGGNRDSPAPPNRRHNGLNLANRPTGRNHQSSFHQPRVRNGNPENMRTFYHPSFHGEESQQFHEVRVNPSTTNSHRDVRGNRGGNRERMGYSQLERNTGHGYASHAAPNNSMQHHMAPSMQSQAPHGMQPYQTYTGYTQGQTYAGYPQYQYGHVNPGAQSSYGTISATSQFQNAQPQNAQFQNPRLQSAQPQNAQFQNPQLWQNSRPQNSQP